MESAADNYRSLWVPKLDTLWSAKVKLADAAIVELEGELEEWHESCHALERERDELGALLRLAGMKYALPLGGCPTTEEVDLWVADLRNTLETERK
jgi:hypothetical protein